MADFAEIKERVSIEQAAQMLGLEITKSGAQLRAPCRACGNGGPRALALTPAKQLAYCFSAGVGGDVIFLVSHVEKCSLADAGNRLAEHFRIGQKPTPPPAREKAPEKAGLSPLDYLQSDHEAVVAAGFDPEEAKALGIGFASKGLMRGTVAVPIRTEDGMLVGYIGLTEARLPPKGLLPRSNVVPLKKGAA